MKIICSILIAILLDLLSFSVFSQGDTQDYSEVQQYSSADPAIKKLNLSTALQTPQANAARLTNQRLIIADPENAVIIIAQPSNKTFNQIVVIDTSELNSTQIQELLNQLTSPNSKSLTPLQAGRTATANVEELNEQ